MKNKNIIGKRFAVAIVSAVTLLTGCLLQPAEAQAQKDQLAEAIKPLFA